MHLTGNITKHHNKPQPTVTSNQWVPHLVVVGLYAGTGAQLSQDELMLKDECILVDEGDNIVGHANKHSCHRFEPGQPKGVFIWTLVSRALLLGQVLLSRCPILAGLQPRQGSGGCTLHII
jgi:hypothetical protein